MFEDLKVVELAAVLAGPLTGTFFAELGADVVKVENKSVGGDATRNWKLPSEDSESSISAYYCSANYGKKSLLLNLKDKSDLKTVHDLIRNADVVIQNYKPGTAEKLGMDYYSLKEINEDIIYASLTGYGENDFRPAFDVVLQAETGYMSMNGMSDGPPVKMPVAMIDVLAAHHLKEAILCALIEKMKTGKGKHIEVSLYESALASLSNQATNWLMAGHIPKRMGTQHPNIAPYGDMYITSDQRYLVLAVGTDNQFNHMANVLEIDISGFETNVLRVNDRIRLNQVVSEKISKEKASHWEHLFQEQKVPFGIVKNMKEVFETPQAQKTLLKETIEGHETIRVKTALV